MNQFKIPHTQKNEVLRYMLAGRGITSMQAFHHFGITRLSSVIYYLREEGIDVRAKDRRVLTCRGGRLTRIAEYFLTDDETKRIRKELHQ